MENITSEQQLKQLLDEGKISQDEYKQLLSAMNKNTFGIQGLIAPNRQNIPISLKIVAWLFIIGGIFSVIEILFALTQSRIKIDFGVLGLFIGQGLMRFSRGWRTCALVFIWIGLIILPIVFLAVLSGKIPAYFELFGTKVTHIPSWLVSIGVIPFFLLLIWEYRVLTRPNIKSLFGVNRH
jgi:hypothetical protein